MGILLFAAFVMLALWAVRTRPANAAREESLTETLRSAATNPVKFAKSRFTGGIGVAFTADPVTGNPLVNSVISGSPAEMAGLRTGDRVMQVDGVATAGRTLAQNIESIRGFTVSSVRLTIQRTGSTNLECIIRRTSWKNLGIPQ